MKNIDTNFFDGVHLALKGEIEKAAELICSSETQKNILVLLENRFKVSLGIIDAKEIFDESLFDFLNILKSGKIKGKDHNFAGLLYKICKNKCITIYRNNSKIGYFEDIFSAEKRFFEKEFDIVLSNDEVELKNNAKKALNAFNQLKEDCKKRIKLKYIENKSHKFIQNEMGDKDDRVSITLVRRCIKTLLELMPKMPANFTYKDLDELINYLELQ